MTEVLEKGFRHFHRSKFFMMMRFRLVFRMLFFLGVFGCSQESHFVHLPSIGTMEVEYVNVLDRTRYGRRKLAGKKCSDIIAIIQSCNMKQIVKDNKDNSHTIILVSAMYNGIHIEITLPIKSGKMYSVAVNPEQWQRIQHYLD